MTKLRVLDLFAGIGGFSLGLHRTGGFETVGFCEMKPHAQAVLAKNFPGVPCHSDVTTYPFTEGEADVITAGFPCQDISFAGEGAGLAGARSGLYREVVRALRVVRPRYAVLENVAALLSRGLGTVLGDVAAVGYDAEWHCIPASAAGAPHRRDRIWIVAHPRGEQHEGHSAPLSGSIAAQLSEAYLANTSDCGYGPEDGPGQDRGSAATHQGEGDQRQWLWPEFGGGSALMAEADRQGQLQPQGPEQDEWRWPSDGSETLANAECLGRSEVEQPEPRGAEGERATDTPQYPSQPAGRGWWAVEPGLGRVADGVPNRVDRLEELGNAVVPQIPEIIGHAILESLKGRMTPLPKSVVSSLNRRQDEARIALPWPPSVNNLYISAGHKRVRSPRYRKWQEEAGWRLKAAHPPRFDGPVEIIIDLCPPDNRRTDADNRNKALLDLLVTHQVIPGDDRRYVKSVTARFIDNQVHSCVVTVRSI